jgi:hypothetical protein
MGNFPVKDPKAVVCIVFAVFSAAAMFGCLLVGSVYYFDEHSKILNYDNTMCKVNSSKIEVYGCSSTSQKHKKVKCYGVIWNVYHGHFYDILATINDESRYNIYTDVIQREYKYKVRK